MSDIRGTTMTSSDNGRRHQIWLISHPDPGLRIAIRRNGIGWEWKVEREVDGLLDTLAEGTALTRKRARAKAERASARIRRAAAARTAHNHQ